MDFYGTIGPACADVKLLQQMVEAGMTGIRMNLSHGPLAAHKDFLVMLHKAGVKKLLIDLQGPELRIGRLPQPLSLTAGEQNGLHVHAPFANLRWESVLSTFGKDDIIIDYYGGNRFCPAGCKEV